MTKAKNVIALAALSALTGSALTAQAASFTWTAGAGTGINWSTGFGGTYPIAAADTATIGPVAGNLTTNIDVTNSTMGMLTFGSASFTTDIGNNNSTGNGLIFNNTGGTGNAQINTTAGTNTISAPIILGGNTDFGTSSLTNLAVGSVVASGAARQFNNVNPNLTLTINGPIFAAEAGATTARSITLNGNGSSTVANGNLVLNGAFSSNGVSASLTAVAVGTGSTNNAVNRSTVTINADNSGFAGNITLAKANFILNNANQLGTGRLLFGGGSNVIDAFVTSAADRVVNNTQTQIQQFHALTGTTNWTFNNVVLQSASRGTGNFLTGNAVLTFNAGLYSGNSSGDQRVMNLDGPGRTIVNGGLHNGYDQTNNVEFNTTGAAGTYDKRGTGVVVVNGTSTYLGGTRIRGGLLEFATSAAYGVGAATAGNGITIDAGGAVGLQTGSLDPAFLARIALGGGSNANTVTAGGASVANTTNFPSYGALALTNNDTNTAINYSGNLSAPFLQTMGLGAVSAGANYAGTITPAASTYRLGGGGVLTLTNPGGNQLTGANSVVADNGGTVAITGSNNYTGSTTVGGVYINPSQELIRFGQTTSVVTTSLTAALALRASSTISVTSLANGGSPSSLGSSSNAASNLVINGGTLQYAGGTASSTDRQMTVTALGATLDASGSGAVNFTNTAPVVMQDPAGRAGILDTTTKTILYVDNPNDLTVGMGVTGTGIAAGTTIKAIVPPSFNNIGGTTNIGPYQIILSANATGTGYQAIPDLAFTTGLNRTIGFTGTSTAANTFSGSIANSAAGGTVSISKTGAGAWALAGSNTYTGSTSVTGGTLQINAASALPTAAAITVGGTANQATLKIGGPITLNLSTLTLASNGRFDVGNGTLNNTTNGGGAAALAAAKAAVVAGYNGGAWNGTTGYITSSGDASHGVGYKDTGTGIQYRYTLYGDADLDGGVSIVDFNVLSANFGQSTGKFWTDGDFDYDGGVSIIDFNRLAASFGQNVPANSPLWAGLLAFAPAHNDLAAFEAVTGVPEPTSLGLLAAGVTLGLRRRRRA